MSKGNWRSFWSISLRKKTRGNRFAISFQSAKCWTWTVLEKNVFVMSSLTCFGPALHSTDRCGWLTRTASGEFTLGLRCILLRENTILPVTDAYSTQYELQMSQKSSALLLALGAMPQTCDLEQAAQLPEYLKEPVDFWCETGALSASVQEQTLLVSGKLRYCMLGTDADGAPVYFEQAQDVAQEYQLETKAEQLFDLNCLSQCRTASMRSRRKNKLQYHCKLQVDGMVLGVIPVSFITGIKVDETREKKRENQSAMTIYYADAGENIWSIAKRYNTSLSAVMEENGLEEEILPEKQIVLIPMIG